MGNSNKYNGSVGLVTVLIVGVILLVSGITIVLLSIDLQRVNTGVTNRIVAKSVGKSCFEESMNIIKDDLAYTGTYNYSDEDGSCISTISNVSPGVTDITVVSTVNDYTYTETHEIDVSQYPPSIND